MACSTIPETHRATFCERCKDDTCHACPTCSVCGEFLVEGTDLARAWVAILEPKGGVNVFETLPPEEECATPCSIDCLRQAAAEQMTRSAALSIVAHAAQRYSATPHRDAAMMGRILELLDLYAVAYAGELQTDLRIDREEIIRDEIAKLDRRVDSQLATLTETDPKRRELVHELKMLLMGRPKYRPCAEVREILKGET